MAKTTLSFKMSITGLRETIKAFQDLPKDASKRLRDETLKLSEVLAVKARAEGVAEGHQAALVATTVKAVKDRVPAIQAGGEEKLGRHQAPAYGLLFASVFGMNARSGWFAKRDFKSAHGHQYKEHAGRNAYWFFPVIEENQAEIAAAWSKVADGIVRDFSEGG